MLTKKFYKSNDYEATSFMPERGTSICNIFGRHCVSLACKEKGVDEWRMWPFTIRSMLCHAVLPHISQELLPEEVALLRDNLGLQRDWQREDLKYTKEQIKPENRNKLKKFIEDEMLSKILHDGSFNHMSKSRGCHVYQRQASCVVIADPQNEEENQSQTTTSWSTCLIH